MALSDVLKNAIAVVKADEAKIVLPAVASFFNTVAANPTALSLAAALTKFNVDVISAQPNIGQAALQDLAGAVNSYVQAELAALAAPKAG